MSGLIEQLVEEMKGVSSICGKWRSLKNDPPDPETHKTMLVYEVNLDNVVYVYQAHHIFG